MGQGFDRKTRASISLDIAHNRVHEGQLIYGYKLYTAVGGSATNSLYINTSDPSFEAHVRLLATVEEKATVTIYRATVAPTAPITPVTIRGRKYMDDETANAKTKIYEAVTGGTWFEVDKYLIPAGSGNFAVGGQSGNVNEIILNENDWYRIDFTNDATAQDLEIRLEFYEVNEAATLTEDFGNPAL